MDIDSLRVQGKLPRHVAIIMDGNGRYASLRGQPRTFGHQEGAKRTKEIIKVAAMCGIETLTMWAFGKENILRDAAEVNFLFDLMLEKLTEELPELHANQVRLRIIGDRSIFNQSFINYITYAEELTKFNSGLKLNIAINYSGRWDIVNTTKKIAQLIDSKAININEIDQKLFNQKTVLGEFSDPDLLIRTGGVFRLSNYILWNLAFTELYFTDTLWPDFDKTAFDLALIEYAKRVRRFGIEDNQNNKLKEAQYVE